MFFQRANYLEPIKYEEQFDNNICQRENEEIKRIINSNIDIDSNIIITDIGCGTGLGNTLLNQEHAMYVGIDSSKKSIEYCKQNHKKGHFIQATAENFIKHTTRINPIFLFSLDYLSVRTVYEYLEKTDKIFIAIHYNKPYLSPTSVYKKQKFWFDMIHPKRKKKKLFELLDEFNAERFKLLDEDYYYVTIVRK